MRHLSLWLGLLNQKRQISAALQGFLNLSNELLVFLGHQTDYFSRSVESCCPACTIQISHDVICTIVFDDQINIEVQTTRSQICREQEHIGRIGELVEFRHSLLSA